MRIKIKNREAMRLRKRLRKLEAKQRVRHPPPFVRPSERGTLVRPSERATLALVLAISALLSSCATRSYTPHVEIPRLVLQQPCECPQQRDFSREIDLDIDFSLPAPLPFVKHSLAELEADEAAALRAHPEREALEANAAFQINTLLQKLDRL
jgi:hypothetical protein